MLAKEPAVIRHPLVTLSVLSLVAVSSRGQESPAPLVEPEVGREITECGDAGLYAGCSLFFAKPHLKESFKAFAVDLTTGTQNLIGFSHSYDLSPRVWLGYQGPQGLGVRGAIGSTIRPAIP